LLLGSSQLRATPARESAAFADICRIPPTRTRAAPPASTGSRATCPRPTVEMIPAISAALSSAKATRVATPSTANRYRANPDDPQSKKPKVPTERTTNICNAIRGSGALDCPSSCLFAANTSMTSATTAQNELSRQRLGLSPTRATPAATTVTASSAVTSQEARSGSWPGNVKSDSIRTGTVEGYGAGTMLPAMAASLEPWGASPRPPRKLSRAPALPTLRRARHHPRRLGHRLPTSPAASTPRSPGTRTTAGPSTPRATSPLAPAQPLRPPSPGGAGDTARSVLRRPPALFLPMTGETPASPFRVCLSAGGGGGSP